MSVPVSLHSLASSVLVFSGINFSDWKEQIQFHLGVLDLDLALRIDKPAAITETSSSEQQALFKSWERSNRLSIMFMRMCIANNIKSTLPQIENAKEYFKAVEDRFRSADKSLGGRLMAELTTMKFDGSRGMNEHVLEMNNLAARLKSLGMNVDESFLVQFILNSLPTQYGPFQIHYNTIKEKWNVNELASMLIQEEARLRQQGQHSINVMSHGVGSKGKKPKKSFKKDPLKVAGPSHDNGTRQKEHNGPKCYFCRGYGHLQKNCPKRRAWFEKKGKLLAYVCFESNMTQVPSNTWWIDSGSTIHVSNSMQGYLSIQNMKENEHFIVLGNGTQVPVVGVGTLRLSLESGHCLDLFDTFYVPTISRNLISMSRLDYDGYALYFKHKGFRLLRNDSFVGSGVLSEGLYRFNLNKDFAKTLLTLHHDVGTKRSRVNENSSFLWHKRLGHISRERMERLVKDEILSNLDLLISMYVWIALKESKPNIQRKAPQEVENFWRLSILIFVNLSTHRHLVEKSTLSLSSMIFHVMVMSICCMKSLKQ